MAERDKKLLHLANTIQTGIFSCPSGMEFQTLQLILRPDPYFLGFSHQHVVRDLYESLFEKFQRLQIRPFGSFETGMAFKGYHH